MALTDYVPGWLRPAQDRTEQRIADYQQLLERAQNHVRKSGGDPNAFGQAMETAAVKASGAPPLRPATEPGDRLSDWEIADRLASSKLKPREVEVMVSGAAAAAIGPQIAKRDDVRQAAADYRASLIAAAPAAPAATERQTATTSDAPRRRMSM